MKTKEIIKLGCMVSILGFHAGCNSRLVNSERNRTKMVKKEDVRINSQTSELINGNRLLQFTDSSNKFFSIKIFPLDTFTFSVNDGFKGKASKIEWVGTEQDMKHFSDSMGIRAESEKSLRFELESEIKEKVIRASKEVKSRRTNWVLGLGLVGFIIVLYGLLQIRKRFRNIS